MNQILRTIFSKFEESQIDPERKEVLQPLITYIREKQSSRELTRLNFICTRNSRRSHLAQIWAQTAANYFGIENINCYSGGTVATALFPMVAKTLVNQGFEVQKLSESINPVYGMKFDQNEQAIICFSKSFDHPFNPKSQYAAIITCNAADEACPLVIGAEVRIPVKYGDPKVFDEMAEIETKYAERSFQIGQEMWYIFSAI